ncbi:hypothetical protein [Allorhodopirellula solitaria]|uniref:hypothetical protein n=1 Tax=Allorhodopirellula solitaria TaxID=2527987 RepID=UPI0011B42C10|nr:hypothetical protein [Allorhodopirellula solitaria]
MKRAKDSGTPLGKGVAYGRGQSPEAICRSNRAVGCGAAAPGWDSVTRGGNSIIRPSGKPKIGSGRSPGCHSKTVAIAKAIYSKSRGA